MKHGETPINRNGFYLSDFTDDVSIGFLHKIDTAGESVSFSQIDSIYIWDIAIGPNDEINGVAENYGTNGELFGQTINTGNFIFQCTDSFTLNYLIEQPGPFTNPYYSNTYPTYLPHIELKIFSDNMERINSIKFFFKME